MVFHQQSSKPNYFYTLRQADSGDIEPFIDYIAENVSHSLEIMIKGAKGEEIDDLIDYAKKNAALLRQQLKASPNKVKAEVKEKIMDIYDNSIARFYDKMNAAYKNYDEFYEIKRVFLCSQGYGIFNNIEEGRKIISKNTNEITIFYQYSEPKELNLENFYGTFTFIFNQEGYILNSPDTIITKKYSERLEEQEIDTVIKSELDKLLKAIKSKI